MIKAKEDKRPLEAFSLYKMGKDKAVVTKFLERFKSKNGDPDKTATATSDMIHGFRSAMREKE